MLKIWGRNTSSNVQKVIWGLAEMKLPFERIDVGGAFGKTKDPFYLAMNPNSLVPTLEEEDGFTLWESNSILRYLAAKHSNRTLEPADLKTRALAHKWMDWQLSVMAPAITPVFWGLIRTPPEKRDANAIAAGKEKTIAAAKIMDAQLGTTQYPGRQRLFLRRHSGRHHDVSLHAAHSGAAGDAEPRPLVRRDLVAAGVQGADRGGAAVVAPDPVGWAKAQSAVPTAGTKVGGLRCAQPTLQSTTR